MRAEDVASIVAVPDVALSPDGRVVAYTRVDVDLEHDEYRSAIYVVPADGGEPARLTRGAGRDWAPRWSPDGRWLAFLSDRDGKPGQLYLLPVGGGEPHRLTSLAGGAGPAAWSPDGARVAFCARVSKDQPPDDRAARERWTKRPRVVARGAYKADGSGYTFDAVSQLFVAALDSGAVTALTAAYQPDGLNIGANLGRAAGAGIPQHLHLHVLPRWSGDTNFMTSVAGVRVMPQALNDSWEQLRPAWPTQDGA